MLGRGALGAIVAVVAMAALSAVPKQATAFIYWVDGPSQTIGRADNDGSHVNDAFIQTGSLPFAVAVDSAHIYWANFNEGTIGRANLDGSGVDNSFITGISHPTGVAVDGSSIYWSSNAGPVGRADIGGSNPNPSFITGAAQTCGVALDAGHVYWANLGTPSYIGRAGLLGSNVEQNFVSIPGASFPCGVAVNSANIFWSEPGFLGPNGTRLGRANTSTGTGADPNFIGNANAPCGVALDGASHLYWSNSLTNTIARANTDGTAVNESLFATGGHEICGLAIDSLSTPPTPPAPPPGSRPAADTTPPQTKIVKGPGRKLAKGKARFGFSSSEPGSRFECKLDRGKAKPCRSPKGYSGLGPGRHSFSVWAIDAAGNKDATPARRGFRVLHQASAANRRTCGRWTPCR